jgi:MYXO-CTERM domain-containing protein
LQLLKPSRAALQALLPALALALPASGATSLVGQQVDLTYNFGNFSGNLSATVGDGPEFVLEGIGEPGFESTGTIDISADTLTLSHNRVTILGPGFPDITDDVLIFTFPNLPAETIEGVTLTADPMPDWFGGLDWTGNSITLTQLVNPASVSASTKEWSIDLAGMCPTAENPFGADGVLVFTGSTGDAWEGCADLVVKVDAGTTTRAVFVTGGNQPSPPPQVPCQMPPDTQTPDPDDRIVAEGDELCGVDAIIEVDRGGATIDDFVPSDPSITSVMPQTFPTQSIRVVTVPPVASPLGEPWYHKLGDITITVPQDDSRIVAKSGVGVAGILSSGDTSVPMDVNLYQPEGVGAVRAGLQAEGLVNNVLFIPEPAPWLQWPSALLALALLARLRRRREA